MFDSLDRCPLCGSLVRTTGKLLCPDCWSGCTDALLSHSYSHFCTDCGMPLETAQSGCPRCRADPAAAQLYSRSLFRYAGVIREALLMYKFHDVRALSRLFASLLDQFVNSFTDRPVIYIPVPCSHESRAGRGWDQMTLIAQQLERRGAEVEYGIGRTVRSTQQKHLGKAERHSIPAGSFYRTVSTPTAPGSQQLYILIDDVYTTGSTLRACSSLLRESGRTQIIGLTITMD
jgi:ComF family protein